jgi:hypothetical protein
MHYILVQFLCTNFNPSRLTENAKQLKSHKNSSNFPKALSLHLNERLLKDDAVGSSTPITPFHLKEKGPCIPHGQHFLIGIAELFY